MTYFVAFYSYKGGVGRSLALANVAYSLASRGKRVVMVDMDLEAPALHGIPELELRGKVPKPGFIEYAASYARRGKCPAIGRYVHPCKRSPGAGKLWLMPGGRFNDAYQETLGQLVWRRLHPRKGTGPFVESLRQALVEELEPHYVLIDARTGFSDVGGLSTHLLADMVVLVFNLTRPCIEGSVRAYRSFTAEGSRVRAVQLVASPVPPIVPGAGSVVEKRMEQAKELMPRGLALGRKLLRIEYDPAMVLAEDLAVRKPEELRAAERYEALREAIQRANPAEVLPVVEEARRRRSKGRLEEGLQLLRDFVTTHPKGAEGHLELGSFLLEAGRAAEAIEPLKKAVAAAPEQSMPLFQLGLAQALAADSETGQRRGQFLQEARKWFEQAVRHKPDMHEALCNWGNALAKLAVLEKGDQRRDLLLEACTRYEEAVRYKPDMHEALYNWGNALAQRADLERGSQRRDLLLDACARYEETLRHKPDMHEALNNWESALFHLATFEKGQRRRELLQEAAERARQASAISPHAGNYNLACALSLLGEVDEASQLAAQEVSRQPEMRSHALQDSDLDPLWKAHPELRQAIEESLDSGDDLGPIRQWLDARAPE